MSSLTLSPSNQTYISKKYPSSDLSGAERPQTCQYYLGIDKLTQKSDSDISHPLALFQFTRPVALKYKKITRATLSWNTQTYGTSSITKKNYVAPYKSDASLSDVNYTTYKELGEVGEFIQGTDVDITASSSSSPAYCDTHETFEIKNLFVNNLKNDKFNIFIATGVSEAFDAYYHPQYNRNTSIYASQVHLYIEYEDYTQQPPTPLYPRDTTLLEAGSTIFSWRFNSETEAVQDSAVLQYKKSTDADYTSVNIGTEHSYVLNTFLSAGTYQWRIKATNDAGDESSWSEVATWNVIGQPAAPTIGDVPNKTLTTITWSSDVQFACEVMLYDSNNNLLDHETFATSEAIYKPNMFLKGSYTFMVRIKNSADLWSEWAQKAFAITASGPAAGTLSVVPEDTQVRLEYTFSTGSAALIRNGKVLAICDGQAGTFFDDTVEPDKAYTYTLRTYVDGYTDSGDKSVTVHFGGATFRTSDGSIHLKLSEDKFIPYSERISREMAVMKFSGREYPLIERGEFTSVEFERRFFVTFEEKKLLDKMCKAKDVYYRDNKGNALKCAISGISYNNYKDEGYIATMSMIRTEEEEVIVNV